MKWPQKPTCTFKL